MSEDNVNLDTLLEINPSPPQNYQEINQPHQSNTSFSSTISTENPDIATLLVNDQITYSPSRTNNYKFIRFLSFSFKMLVLLFLGFSVLSGLVAFRWFESSYSTMTLDVALAIFATFLNIQFAAICAILSEGINVVLDTEANTRQAAKTLERLLRSQS